MGNLVLPPELFDEIFRNVWLTPGINLGNGRKDSAVWNTGARKQALDTIRACALVSKVFSAQARNHLFTDVTITVQIDTPYSQSAKALLEFMENDDSIGRRVQSVTLILRGWDSHTLRNMDQVFEDELAATFLKKLPLLRQFHIALYEGHDGYIECQNFFSRLNPALFSAIQHLRCQPDLHTFEVGPNIHIDWDLVEHWPSLETLILHRHASLVSRSNSWESIDWKRTERTKALRNFECGPMSRFYSIDQHSPFFDHLRQYRAELDDVSRSSRQERALYETLSKSASSLEVFHLKGNGLCGLIANSPRQLPPFDGFPSIKYACLREVYVATQSVKLRAFLKEKTVDVSSILGFLEDLAASPALERFCLEFSYHNERSSPGIYSMFEHDIISSTAVLWSRLDKALSSRVGGVLKIVEVNVRLLSTPFWKDTMNRPWLGFDKDLEHWKPHVIFPKLLAQGSAEIRLNSEVVKNHTSNS